MQPAKERPEFLRRLEEASPRKRQDILRTHIRDQVVNVLGLDPSIPIRPQQGLFDVGLNSLAAVELMNHLQTSLGQPLSSTLVFDYPTIESLSEYLASTVLPLKPSGASQVEPPIANHPQAVMDLHALEQLSEDEAEALLIKKLEGIEKKLS
jgi:acyl carrier protein